LLRVRLDALRQSRAAAENEGDGRNYCNLTNAHAL
jgi:hypothetical protein